MIDLPLLVFVLAIIATGCLQVVTNNLPEIPLSPNSTTTKQQQWLQQLDLRCRGGKPCPMKSNSSPDGPGVPSYSYRIVRPLHKSISQPQTLKNEEYKISASAENEQVLNLSRRESSLSSSSSQKDDDDCHDRLNLSNLDSFSDPNAEKIALLILENCFKKKQNSLRKHISRIQKRSMSEPDPNDKNDNNYRQKVSDSDDLFNNNALLENDVDETEGSRRQKEDSSSGTGKSYPRSGTTYMGCYTCSTATNHMCSRPHKKDKNIKRMCPMGERSCAIKSFNDNGITTIIRGCSDSCYDHRFPGKMAEPCEICATSYCNSARTTTVSLANILIISIVKCIY